ncbi:phosphomethylpyrimidine kinase [Anopheles sinensis]|uniref:Phosphomethylpyrimidine kinase n=1 Tax=Anopheles sinensis TaxID=74873 RepID=A0A084VSY6_ANOSI|nr:phosphomethylpyrimidine kinase [Anopheles sinensis]
MGSRRRLALINKVVCSPFARFAALVCREGEMAAVPRILSRRPQGFTTTHASLRDGGSGYGQVNSRHAQWDACTVVHE